MAASKRTLSKIERTSAALANRLLKFTPRNMQLTFRASMDPHVIVARWSANANTSTNWGDAFTPHLIKILTGRVPIHRKQIFNPAKRPVYSVTGSILDNCREPHLVVWGSGFHESQASLKVSPRKIHAVRGPLTRQRLLDQGLDCPEVFGDPALLYPLFYKPSSPQKKFALGVVPHYAHKSHPFVKHIGSSPEVLIIDIQGNINQVVNEIVRCERIASSSLHGLIIADAYNIPSKWIKLSKTLGGGGFKFHDYFASVGREEQNPPEITSATSFREILDNFSDYTIDINLDKLMSECPLVRQ